MNVSTGMVLYLLRCGQPQVPPPAFQRASIRLLQDLGSVFLEAAPHPAPPCPHPESEVTAEGHLWVTLDFLHPLLRREKDTCHEESFIGSYRETFDERSCLVKSGYFKTDDTTYEGCEDSLATGRLTFLRLILPHYCPELAVLDSIWDHGIKERHLENCELRRLFWTTYFGKKYVEKHGRQFFLDTPAWKVEEIADGILITVTEKYLDFSRNEPKETLKHLRQKFKGIRPNRYKEDPNF